MRNPTTISLGAAGRNTGGWSQCLFRCYGTRPFIQSSELSRCRGHRPLQGEIRRSGRCKHHSISWRKGRTKEPLRNKHHSLGENGGLFLEWWCLCLSAPVFIVWMTIWVPARGVRPVSSVYGDRCMQDWKIVRVYACLLKAEIFKSWNQQQFFFFKFAMWFKDALSHEWLWGFVQQVWYMLVPQCLSVFIAFDFPNKELQQKKLQLMLPFIIE